MMVKLKLSDLLSHIVPSDVADNLNVSITLMSNNYVPLFSTLLDSKGRKSLESSGFSEYSVIDFSFSGSSIVGDCSLLLVMISSGECHTPTFDTLGSLLRHFQIGTRVSVTTGNEAEPSKVYWSDASDASDSWLISGIDDSMRVLRWRVLGHLEVELERKGLKRGYLI